MTSYIQNCGCSNGTYYIRNCDCSGVETTPKLSRKMSCDCAGTSTLNATSTQKKIWNQSRVESSAYTMNLKSFIAGSDENFNKNEGVRKKHSSYERFLSKKKFGHLRKQNSSNAIGSKIKCEC